MTYTYDNADELTLVVEGASRTAVNENYTWYADGTLKTYPGPGYTRLLDYDKEGRITSIKRDNGTTQTLAYEYAYGFDGGRRWRKDYDNNIWNWFPCGVACSAGELAVLQNSVGGITWSAQWQLVPGKTGSFSNNCFPSQSIAGTLDQVYDNNGSVSYETSFDQFEVGRLGVGANAQGIVLWLAMRRFFDDEQIASKRRKNVAKKCAVKICSMHGFVPWGIQLPSVTHQYVCASGLSGGCSGGLYDTGVSDRAKKCGDHIESDGEHEFRVTCYTVNTDCRVADRACACIETLQDNPPKYNLITHNCLAFKKDVQRCVESLYGPTYRIWGIAADW